MQEISRQPPMGGARAARTGPAPVFGAAIVALLPALALGPTAARAQTVAATVTLPTVEVVGTTPLPGAGVPTSQIPSNVQTARSADLDRSHAGRKRDRRRTGRRRARRGPPPGAC